MNMFVIVAHPDKALVGRADAPLHVDAQRPLGLLRGNGAHQRGVVLTRHMADEGTYCRGKKGREKKERGRREERERTVIEITDIDYSTHS